MDAQLPQTTQTVPDPQAEKIGNTDTNQTSQIQPVGNTPVPKQSFKFIFIILPCVIIGIFLVIRYTYMKNIASNQESDTVPTQVNLPKVIQPIATSSAFLSLEEDIASLSGKFSTVVIRDESLIPPVLELPLGFSTK